MRKKVKKISKFFDTLRARKDSGQSTLILVTGMKGKGKSWLVIRASQIYDKSFKLTNCFFSSDELFAALNKGVPAGSAVIYDEVGVGSNSKDAMTNQNKSLSFIAQTIRPSRVVVFFVTITKSLFDRQTRNLVDYELKVLGHNKEGFTRFKFKKVVPSDENPKPYLHHLKQYYNKEKVPRKIISWIMRAPKNGIAQEYDKMRNAYTQQVYSDAAMTTLTGRRTRFGKQKKLKSKKDMIPQIVDMVLARPETYPMHDRDYVIKKIGEDFGLGRSYATVAYMNAKNSRLVV